MTHPTQFTCVFTKICKPPLYNYLIQNGLALFLKFLRLQLISRRTSGNSNNNNVFQDSPPTLLMKICAFSFISLSAPEQTLLCELFGVSPKVILSFNVVHILWQIVCVQSHYLEKSKHPKNCKCCPGHSLTISYI